MAKSRNGFAYASPSRRNSATAETITAKEECPIASIIVLIGGCFGFTDRLAERLAPKPDYYKLFFTELARQATLATGTPTIIKQDEDTLKFFENEYNRRNAKLGLAVRKRFDNFFDLLSVNLRPDDSRRLRLHLNSGHESISHDQA